MAMLGSSPEGLMHLGKRADRKGKTFSLKMFIAAVFTIGSRNNLNVHSLENLKNSRTVCVCLSVTQPL